MVCWIHFVFWSVKHIWKWKHIRQLQRKDYSWNYHWVAYDQPFPKCSVCAASSSPLKELQQKILMHLRKKPKQQGQPWASQDFSTQQEQEVMNCNSTISTNSYSGYNLGGTHQLKYTFHLCYPSIGLQSLFGKVIWMTQTGQKSKNLGSLYSLRDITRYLTTILEYSPCKNGDIQDTGMLFGRQVQLK